MADSDHLGDLADPTAQELHTTPPSNSDCTETFDERSQELIDEMKKTADLLASDQASLGDLKILHRAFRELRYAFSVFQPFRQHRKVTVFGSARTPSHEADYQQAVQLGRAMADRGWLVLTGAGSGIMEAAHVGAGREQSMGVNIMLPFEQDANPVIANDPKLVHLKYFFTRKLLFVKEVHGVVLCPGGFGTQDEGFETLTLIQTGKRDLMPVIMIENSKGSYWSEWLRFVRSELLENGLISPSDMSLFKITRSVDQAVDELINFYRVFHSMRYVRGQLVLRLQARPDSHFIDHLNDEFSDLLESGRIENVAMHPDEQDEPQAAELPRLGLMFNRRKMGRLRELVDVLNDQLSPDYDV